jgi:hypothetical protein
VVEARDIRVPQETAVASMVGVERAPHTAGQAVRALLAPVPAREVLVVALQAVPRVQMGLVAVQTAILADLAAVALMVGVEPAPHTAVQGVSLHLELAVNDEVRGN